MAAEDAERPSWQAPAPWTCAKSKSRGAWYFHNPTSGVSAWFDAALPEGWAVLAGPHGSKSFLRLQDGVERHTPPSAETAPAPPPAKRPRPGQKEDQTLATAAGSGDVRKVQPLALHVLCLGPGTSHWLQATSGSSAAWSGGHLPTPPPAVWHAMPSSSPSHLALVAPSASASRQFELACAGGQLRTATQPSQAPCPAIPCFAAGGGEWSVPQCLQRQHWAGAGGTGVPPASLLPLANAALRTAGSGKRSVAYLGEWEAAAGNTVTCVWKVQPWDERVGEEIAALRSLGEAGGFFGAALLPTAPVSCVAVTKFAGPTLAEHAASGPIPLSAAMQVVAAVLRQLSALHATHLHADIHAENVCVPQPATGSPTWEAAQLIDFGSARPLSRPGAGGAGALRYEGPTRGGLWVAQPREQFDDPTTLDATSDIFSLASLLYFLLSGEYPFTPPRGQKMRFKSTALHALRRRGAVHHAATSRGMPAAVAAWLQRALEPDRARRFPDAASALQALQSCLPPPSQAAAAAQDPEKRSSSNP